MTETASSIPGITVVPSEDYHADKVANVPTLSASLAHVLCSESPRHAWAQHPKLNPDFVRMDDAKFDVGTVVHAALLEPDRTVFRTIDAPDWRTNAAKEARDEARAEGIIPLLPDQEQKTRAMFDALREQLGEHEAVPPLFSDGKPEQTLVWEEALLGGVVCRARLDWLRDDLTTIDDLKTTSRSADPEAWSRTMFGIGTDLKAAFYIRGVHALTGAVPEFRWVVAETSPPYAISVLSPGPDVLTMARKKVEWAIHKWWRCLQDDVWPAYPTRVCYAELPPWEEARWLERETRETA